MTDSDTEAGTGHQSGEKSAVESDGRLASYIRRIRLELHKSLTEDTTPHKVATSFAIGTFITMLPTLGTGLIVFFVLVYLFDWINKVSLFASVLVFNPVVKWGVYAASFSLGFLLLGPVDGFGIGDTPAMSEGTDILVRLLVGNTILAVIATILAYVAAYRVAVAYYADSLPVLEETVESVVEELEKREPAISEEDD